MPPAPLPWNEAERLASLHSYDFPPTCHEEGLDDLVALAARLTDSPIALVSLIGADRQWFMARHGTEVTETHRDLSFCAHALLDPLHALAVEDAAADPRFQTNPLVTGAPGIRAYLGVPLVNPEGHVLGSLCVIDRRPRAYDAGAIATIGTLARAVGANLELHRSLLRSREAALTDPLTGLPNRRRMMEALARAATASEPLAVIAVDLDHFKEVNDGEGHDAGDALLRATAERLREAVRPGDLVGRIGGDEFVVLLAGVTNRGVVDGIAQRISAALHRPVTYGRKSLRLGATLGVAIVPDDIADPEMVLRVADEALIRAKQKTRGGVGCANREDAAQLLRVAAIVRAFHHDAVADHPLRGATVHLQPILSLGPVPGAAAPIHALEALARWSDPAVGAVAPESLFALIGPERAAQLGREVRRQALAAFASLRRAGLEHARIALNLSASEVCRDDVALRLAEEVERAGLSLRCVEIEITEEVLLDRISDRTLDQLAALRGRGARLVLDDFGTGNSGLAQLLRLPLDGLKLDKQFVQRLGLDIRADEIVRATISLAHGLGLRVVAEGVETEAQADRLRDLDCDAVQGFLYARPMPPDVLEGWLRQHRSAGASGATPGPGPEPAAG